MAPIYTQDEACVASGVKLYAAAAATQPRQTGFVCAKLGRVLLLVPRVHQEAVLVVVIRREPRVGAQDVHLRAALQ